MRARLRQPGRCPLAPHGGVLAHLHCVAWHSFYAVQALQDLDLQSWIIDLGLAMVSHVNRLVALLLWTTNSTRCTIKQKYGKLPTIGSFTTNLLFASLWGFLVQNFWKGLIHLKKKSSLLQMSKSLDTLRRPQKLKKYPTLFLPYYLITYYMISKWAIYSF